MIYVTSGETDMMKLIGHINVLQSNSYPQEKLNKNGYATRLSKDPKKEIDNARKKLQDLFNKTETAVNPRKEIRKDIASLKIVIAIGKYDFYKFVDIISI